MLTRHHMSTCEDHWGSFIETPRQPFLHAALHCGVKDQNTYTYTHTLSLTNTHRWIHCLCKMSWRAALTKHKHQSRFVLHVSIKGSNTEGKRNLERRDKQCGPAVRGDYVFTIRPNTGDTHSAMDQWVWTRIEQEEQDGDERGWTSRDKMRHRGRDGK